MTQEGKLIISSEGSSLGNSCSLANCSSFPISVLAQTCIAAAILIVLILLCSLKAWNIRASYRRGELQAEADGTLRQAPESEPTSLFREILKHPLLIGGPVASCSLSLRHAVCYAVVIQIYKIFGVQVT